MARPLRHGTDSNVARGQQFVFERNVRAAATPRLRDKSNASTRQALGRTTKRMCSPAAEPQSCWLCGVDDGDAARRQLEEGQRPDRPVPGRSPGRGGREGRGDGPFFVAQRCAVLRPVTLGMGSSLEYQYFRIATEASQAGSCGFKSRIPLRETKTKSTPYEDGASDAGPSSPESGLRDGLRSTTCSVLTICSTAASFSLASTCE
jgi:hypothetical protein